MSSDNSESSTPEHEAFATAAWSHRRRILLGALICTLIVNILCLFLWTDYDVEGFIRTPFNKQARMEIMYTGTLTGSDSFGMTSSESSLNVSTNFSYRKGAQLCGVDLPIGGEWKPYSFTLEARKKGSIRISLKGPLRCNDYGERYSIFVDYKNLKIRGKKIFSQSKKVTHAKDLSYKIPVNANDIINISFEVRKHCLEIDDFNLGKTKNFWYIVGLSILEFTVFWSLLQYLSTSFRRYAKLEDTVFLLLFFALLAFPMSNISDASKSQREGRTLKRCPKISMVLKEGANYGKEYDDWFCDHLGGREWLLKCHDDVQRALRRIIRGSPEWYMDKDGGWAFGWPFETWVRSEFVQPIVSSLVELRGLCKLHHIKFYVLVVPRKEGIYQEKLYGYGLDKDREYAAIHEQIQRLTAKQHVTYVYPWKELREASKQDYTFFKATHHWTDWGAYISYRALVKEMRKDFPNISVVSLRDYNSTRSRYIRDGWDRSFSDGSYLRRFFNFGLDQCVPPTLYNYYEHQRSDQLTVKMGDYTKDFAYRGGVYKIMVLGDSMNDILLGFLPYSAAQTRFIRCNRNYNLPESEQWKFVKHYTRDILSYKPDILILSVSETTLPQIRFTK